MPLLKKKVFEKHSLPDYLRDDEEVFYCEITNEIFRDYEEFSERMFLYNSMVWTCSMTGKSNLTYQEALESEEAAKQSLKEFPVELRIPILYLASKTQRHTFGEMSEDVFVYVKDRYFIGENLETSFTGNKWKESHVLQVIAPSEEQLQDLPNNGNTTERQFLPPAILFKYEIEHLDADDNDISEIMIVDCNQIRRKKGSFSRERCKLFLKQYIEQDSKGIFTIKQSVIDDFGINKIKFDQIFDGPVPVFDTSKKKERVTNGKKKSKQETLAKYLMKNNGASSTDENKNKNNLLEQMKKREEEFKLKKLLKEKERVALKKKQKQESLKVSNYIRDWSKPKEDLLLEDQKKLPVPTPVLSKVPNKYFGDMLMVMEFIETFSKLLSTKDFFPGGFTLELMERALTEKEVAGPLTDIIQMFLSALFSVQDEESNQYRTAIENATDVKEEDLSDNLSLTEATRLATLASSWSNKYQGLPLGRLPLYSVTVSEILRLHLLSSGARINETGARWRYAQRGGYTSEDDPGLHLRLHQAHILKVLAVHNVVQLSMGDKLQILSCLINQLLTYADVRDILEENIEKTKQLKTDLKTIQLIEKKREQEYMATKWRLQKDMKEDPAGVKETLEKIEKETEKKQIENSRKMNKILRIIYDGQCLLGTDRAYRKYFRLDSVPGIFVNAEEEHPDECLSEICEQNPELVNVERPKLLKYVRKIITNDMNVSHKELDSSKSPGKMNGFVSADLPKDTSNFAELLMCSADPTTCLVHSTSAERTKWSFYHDKCHLDELENSLNKRGFREGELLKVVKHDKERLINIIEQTPVHILNSNIEIKQDEQKPSRNSRKSGKDRYEDANLGYPVDMTPEEVLENALLDNILEMEEKIYAGSLGSLAVKNRDEWRTCLTNKRYEDLEKTVIKREKANILKVKKGDMGKSSRSSTPEISKGECKEYQDPGRFLGASGSSLDLECDDSKEDISTLLQQPERLQQSISSLATALAQVAQAVDSKYLKKPLGSADLSKNDKKQEFDILDRWEQSLLASTSYSQVFLHYGTLDSCVMWSRSALLARCRICRRQKDSENMLLCDNCNLGHHLYCLKPKLTCIPKGDWFCDRCNKEKEKEAKLLSPEPAPLKKRRIFRDEDIEEEEESGEDDEALEEEEDLEEEVEVEEEIQNGEVKVELCKSCLCGGELITCEKCLSNYHIECCCPPMRRAPRGPWHCNACKDHKEARDRRRDSDSGDEVINRRSHRREDYRDDLPLHNAVLQELLSDVMKHEDAWAFIRPVQKNEVPDYYEVISKPMDFGTIKYKLNMGEYNEDQQLMQDAVLVFENCNTYNDTDAEVYRCGVRLLKFFVKKTKELGLKLPEEMESDEQPKVKKRRTK